MFEAPMANLVNINMHNGIIASFIIALIVALSSSCLVYSYAQDHREILNNRIQLAPYADPLSPNRPMTSINSETSIGDNGNQQQQKLRCWSRPTGCTEGELAQIGWPGCAKFRINPKTNRATCEPFIQSEPESTTISPPAPLAQQEESAPEEDTTLIPDFEATIDSLVRAIEFEREQYEQRAKQNQEQQSYHAQLQANRYNHLAAASVGPQPPEDYTMEVQRDQTNGLDINDNTSENKRCNELNYDGDGEDDCGRGNGNNMRDIPGKPSRIQHPRVPSSISGDTNGDSSHVQHQHHQLATRAWRSGHEHDFNDRYPEAAAAAATGSGSGSPPHHDQQFVMTTDEAAKRLAETAIINEQPGIAYLRGQQESSKVPIIMLKFGAIRNQRLPSTSASSDSPSIRLGGLTNKVLSPIRMLSYPIVRLQRSDLNNLTHMEQIKFVKGVDLDGGGSGSGSSPSLVVNRTLVPGSGQQQQQEQEVPATAPGEEKNRPAQQQQPTTTPQPLECTMHSYTFKAVKSDSYGNKCSGSVTANICYGSCETGEIADWLFPYKKAIHKVCTHGARVRREILLKDCSSPDVENQLREYHYVDAMSCVCQKCHSQDTNCLGSLTRPYLDNLDESASPSTAGASSSPVLVD